MHRAIGDDPSTVGHYAVLFARMSRQLHATHVDTSLFENVKDRYLRLPVSVDNEQLAESLMVQRSHGVGKDGTLGVIAVMDAELQVALPGVLCSHSHGRQHHRANAIFIQSKLSGIHCHIMGKDGIGEVRKMEVVGLCGSPWQQHDVVVEGACHAIS